MLAGVHRRRPFRACFARPPTSSCNGCVWMPLALMALHRLVGRPARRPAWPRRRLAGQLLCSIYYGVFLALFAGVAWVAERVHVSSRVRRCSVDRPGGDPAALLVAPTWLLCRQDARRPRPPLGRRDRRATARGRPTTGRCRRSTRARHRGPVRPEERIALPRRGAIGLAVFAFVTPARRRSWVYAGAGAVAFDASLGVIGADVPPAADAVPPLANLRAAARFASLR